MAASLRRLSGIAFPWPGVPRVSSIALPASSWRAMSSAPVPVATTAADNQIDVVWKLPDGTRAKTRGTIGESLLDLARREEIDLEGACEGSIACSTCHVILEPALFGKLPEATDSENDMLDLAFGLTDSSRQGCQIKLEKEYDGMVVQLPSATRNMAVDGHKPKHH